MLSNTYSHVFRWIKLVLWYIIWWYNERVMFKSKHRRWRKSSQINDNITQYKASNIQSSFLCADTNINKNKNYYFTNIFKKSHRICSNFTIESHVKVIHQKSGGNKGFHVCKKLAIKVIEWLNDTFYGIIKKTRKCSIRVHLSILQILMFFFKFVYWPGFF